MIGGAPLPPGTEVGRYRIAAEISAGGMGRVYRATVTEEIGGLAAGSTVALKIVHPHLLSAPGFFKRFLREAEAGQRIRHPNVVATYDLDGIKVGDDTMLYMAMEFVDGKTLWQHFQELGTIPEAWAVHLARELARGLAAIHATGVVHRDVKPENIMVGADGAVKLMDLGVARIQEEDVRVSTVGAFVGSSLYAAPEQFRGAGAEIDARADLYALGVILYELITGRGPHDAEDLAGIMARALTETPPPLVEARPGISPFFSAVVESLLSKSADDRFPSANALIDALSEGESSAWWTNRTASRAARDEQSTASIAVERAAPLVGRTRELAALRNAYVESKGGGGRAVLLIGEAGSGKTRLVDELLAEAAAAGEHVHLLHGACPGPGPHRDSAPFDAACRRHLGDRAPATALRTRLPATAAAALAAHLADETDSSAARLSRDALAPHLARLFASLAAERRTVVFVDDLHRAPRETLDLFLAVAAAAHAGGYLVIGAARHEIPQDWVASVAALPLASTIHLGRLGLRDQAELLVAVAGSADAADALGFAPIEAANGVPGFLIEIVGSLAKSGRAPTGPLPLPPRARDVMQSRVSVLSEDDRELLQMAARIGMEFDPRAAAAALRRERFAVVKRLAKLERETRLVHAVGDQFVFDHPGVRDVLVAETPEALAREYDNRLAEALERLDPIADEGGLAAQIADLWIRGGTPARALRHAARGLDHLDATQSRTESAAFAARVLGVRGCVTGDDRVDMLLAQARRLGVLGRTAEELVCAEEALAITAAANDTARRARAAAAVARAMLHGARYEDASIAAEQALGEAVPAGLGDVEAAVRAILGRVRLETGRYQEALSEHGRELAICERRGDTEGEAAAHGHLGDVHAEMGRFDRAHHEYRREREVGISARDRFARARSKLRSGRMLFVLGRHLDAMTEFMRSRTLFRILGDVKGEARSLLGLGEVALAMSDLAAAERHLTAAAQIARRHGARNLLGRALLGLGAVADARGDRAAAARLATESLELRREIGDRAGIVDGLITLARIRSAAGAQHAAKAALDEARAIARQIGRTGSEVLLTAHLALLPGGDVTAAQNAMAAFSTQTAIEDRIEAHSILWRATGSVRHLEESRELMARVLSHLPPELREAAAARLTNPGVAPIGA